MSSNEIKALEDEIASLRKILQQKEKDLDNLKLKLSQENSEDRAGQSSESLSTVCALPAKAIERYSRQILITDVGYDGQVRLSNSKVLIVGAGGLGCPAALYLAGAGIGHIGIIDYDQVEVTNLHRQVLHPEASQGMSKAESAVANLRRLNSSIKLQAYNVTLCSKNAIEIISQYDLVLDASDNVVTRYLLNDACALQKIPLISGSALKMEGQLTIYNFNSSNLDKDSKLKETLRGPCYRCLFPVPPPPETVGSCSANGVLGPVPGVIGCLQALEAIKLLVGKPRNELMVGRMLLFDGDDCSFKTVKLRLRNPDCEACSDTPKITMLDDYEKFCKAQAKEKDIPLKILPKDMRISPENLQKEFQNNKCHLLVDVRSEAEFRMCHLNGTVNFPIDRFDDDFDRLLTDVERYDRVTFICRRGNDSQMAAKKVMDKLSTKSIRIEDLEGGLHAWSEHVDKKFPIY